MKNKKLNQELTIATMLILVLAACQEKQSGVTAAALEIVAIEPSLPVAPEAPKEEYSQEEIQALSTIEQSLDAASEEVAMNDPVIKATRNKGFRSTELEDGNFLVTGGLGEGCTWSSRILHSSEIFNQQSKATIRKHYMIRTRAFHSATRLVDGRVLIAGGTYCVFNGVFGWITYSMPNAEIYDPKSQTFREISPLKHHRSSHFSFLMKDGKVLIIGGRAHSNEANSAEIFDPETETFTEIKSPEAWTIRSIFALNDGRYLIHDQDGVKVYDAHTGITQKVRTPSAKLDSWIAATPFVPEF